MKNKFGFDFFVPIIFGWVIIAMLMSFSKTVKESQTFKAGIVSYVTTRGR
jgi:hypothetical protein